MEHSKVTDKEIFYEMYSLIMSEILYVPPTDRILKSDVIPYNKNYLQQKRNSLYQYSKEKGYSIFYFIETAYDLLVNQKSLVLDDDLLSEALELMTDFRLKPYNQEDTETYEKYKAEGFELYKRLSKLSRYSKDIEDHEDVVKPELFSGVHWGNVYWLFLHRFLYRLEDRILSLETLEDVNREKQLIKNAFFTFIWFSEVLSYIFKCPYCSEHYLVLQFDKKFQLTVQKHYPHGILGDEKEVTLEKLEAEKAYFRDRPLTMEFYLNHKSHSKALNNTFGYPFTSFLNQLENCKKI